MKKMMMILFVAVLAVGSTGCKKGFSCVCQFNGDEVVYAYGEVDKSDAQDACDGTEDVLQTDDPDASCDLKKD